jgi:calmodulin
MLGKIPKDKEQEIKSIFEKYDSNEDGFVNTSELANIIKSINTDISEEELLELLQEVELEVNGEINFEKFVSIVNRREYDVDTEEELLNAFKIFDKEGNGLINLDELKHIMLKVGKNLSESEIDEMLKDADIDMDGFINYEEFIRSILTK